MFKRTMIWLKRFILLLWLLVMFGLGMLIYNENRELIQVSFVAFEFNALPLGMLVCGLLLVGGVLGYFTSFVQFKTRELLLARRYKKTNRTLDKLKMEQQG